jgi:hypothetical protein
MEENELKNIVLKDLYPEGIWRLSDAIESLLQRQLNRLPRKKVSEEESRYPTTPAGMREFLDGFFARHYFQIQNSLVDYLTSDEFLEIMFSGKIQILDIGCGPAVASLAITDIIRHIINYFAENEKSNCPEAMQISYVLNDTSRICLGLAQEMLREYFASQDLNRFRLNLGYLFAIPKSFPFNMSQLHRISRNLGLYDIAVFSYVIRPLEETLGLITTVDGMQDLELLCNQQSRILIVQDKYQSALVCKFAKSLDVSAERREYEQQVYSDRNDNETFTYSYCSVLYKPRQQKVKQISPAA